MPRVLKYLLITVAASIALVVLAIAIVAATFNPNDYKPALVKLVQDKTQRTLSLPGEIKLTFFPRLGADLGKVSISERGDPKVFASAEHAQVSVALLPILSRQFVVDRVFIDGLAVNLHRYKDNTTNYDDLLPAGEPGAAKSATPPAAKEHAIHLDVGGIAVSNASLRVTDDAKHSVLAVTRLNLTTGPVADRKKSKLEFSAEVRGDKPRLALSINLRGDFTLDLERQRYVLDDLAATLNGSAADFSALQLKLSAPSFEASPKTLKAPALSLDASVTRDARNMSAKLGTALSGDLLAQHFELSGLGAEVVLPNPAGGMLTLDAKGKMSLNLARETVQAALTGKFDATTFDAKAAIAKFAQPALTFDIALGDVDVDRYLSKSPQPAQGEGAAGSDQAIDISALKTLDARGALKMASLKVANLRATDIRLELRAGGGKLDISPLSAVLYGGSLAGSLSATAGGPQRFAAKQMLSNISIGPLLKDVIDRNPADGKGNVTLDVSTTGASTAQLKKGLSGTAGLLLKDGAINGINLAAAIRNAKSKLGMGQSAAQQGSASAQDKTDFTELSGSFKIANGVAHNEDLSAKTPLFRLGGSGDINIGDSAMDYTVRATVVPTLEGQGGADLQNLKGLTIPVRLSGPFNAIGWKIELGALAGNRARELVDERKEQLKAEAQRKLDAQKEQLQEQLKGQLKGLLGR